MKKLEKNPQTLKKCGKHSFQCRGTWLNIFFGASAQEKRAILTVCPWSSIKTLLFFGSATTGALHCSIRTGVKPLGRCQGWPAMSWGKVHTAGMRNWWSSPRRTHIILPYQRRGFHTLLPHFCPMLHPGSLFSAFCPLGRAITVVFMISLV